ncbi:YafY family transcriptional regulator [Lachnospiraceae bacterium OttesenSCG-928-E19]|nr:YafY family transcriptional regulator [Lachnospiraceae bacterium OttesenSCG-928-E19]
MQINRLFEIVYILMDKEKITANELAKHFEVSKRTILRDIDTLSSTGVPVYTIQGKGGGISLMKNFILNKMVLSEEEQNQILFALQGIDATQSEENNELLRKLKSMFKKPNASWIEVDFSHWGASAFSKNKFELIKTAILTKTSISFDYVSSNAEFTKRIVHPLKLVFKSRAWYLQAFCTKRNDYRTFRVSRIIDLTLTKDSFAETEYSPPLIDSEVPMELSEVILDFNKNVAFRVYDEFDENCIHRDDDGNIRVNAKMPIDNWLYDYLRSFGKDVTVISPERLYKCDER